VANARKSIADQPRTLFPIPIKAKWCRPIDVSSDCEMVCRCEDGCDYVIKEAKPGASTLPHSEWFCTALAEAIGIASPPCKIVEMPDSTFAFGSRWEGGVLVPQAGATPGGNWWEKVKSGEIDLDSIKSTLSRIYAFDHFVHNKDRHRDNYIVRNQREAGFAVLANDYSRAWLICGFPLPALPMNENRDNTLIDKRYFARYWDTEYIDKDEACIALARIRNTTSKNIARIIDDHPDDWLTRAQREDILKWWDSQLRLDRIDIITRGIRDGSYL
jgi:hypothetical protein